MKPEKKAKSIFLNGCNCCQAVVVAMAERLKVDAKLLNAVASGYGGGMASMGKTCGAVNGAYMMLGILSGEKHDDNSAIKAQTKEWMLAFNQQFTAEHGSLDCRELLGYDLSMDGQREKANIEGLFETRCPLFVETAV